MKPIALLLLLFVSKNSTAQTSDEAIIRKMLADQTVAWNKGNLETFMQGYWKNDSLLFVGKNGPSYGFQQALANYKKGYPDTAAMGKLSFDILRVSRLTADYYFVLGKWMLKRSRGNLSGHYTLLFRKIGGQWVIVVDHSS